jgi:molybdenum cofactor cytidylyltransferase
MAEITGLLLAAGASMRYGANKLTESLEGDALLLHSLRALEPCDKVVAVVRKGDDEVQELLHDHGVNTVCNSEPWRGMGSSIAYGVQATSESYGWCILPGDMPRVMPATTALVVAALRRGDPLVAPYYQERRGHPVGFNKSFSPMLTALASDVGARHIISQHESKLSRIHIDDAGVLLDIDTAEELAQLVPEPAPTP